MDQYMGLDKNLFIVFVVLAVTVGVCAIVGFSLALTKKERALNIFKYVAAAVIIGLGIAFLVVGFVTSSGDDVSQKVGLYVTTVFVLIAELLVAFLIGKKKDCNHTKSVVYGALCIGLSFALSYVSIFKLPQGGSITFASLLPIMLYSYMFGIRKGLMIGFVYSILQFIQAPWFIHPMQFLADYPFAFMAIGLTGLFFETGLPQKIKNKLAEKNALKKVDVIDAAFFFAGACVALIIRYFSHVISGIYVFGSGDPNYSAVAWSFLYNSFVFVDGAICLCLGIPLFLSKPFVKLLDKASL